jgi:hydrogenase large subunit
MATGANNGFSGAPTTVARLVRNLTQGGEFLMSHITHFYALAALDIVQGPAMEPWTPYWDNSYYDSLLQSSAGLTWSSAGVPNNVYTAVITDYVLALKARVKAIDMGAIFGGRLPIQSSYVAGGTTHMPTTTGINEARNLLYRGTTAGSGTIGIPAAGTVADFIKNHYVPMTEVVSVLHGVADNDQNNYYSAISGLPGTRSPYANQSGLAGVNLGAGCKNFYSAGVFDGTNDGQNASRLIARGTYNNASNTSAGVAADLDPNLVFEYVKYARYNDSCSANPKTGTTIPDPTKVAGYTWHKSPRYPNTNVAESVKEVGPLARMWVNGDYQGGQTKTMRNHAYAAANGGPVPNLAGLTYGCGISVLDRHRARALEAEKICNQYKLWLDDLAANLTGARFDGTKVLPTVQTYGLGLTEAPRGSVLHWTSIQNKKIQNYQIIAPTSWNCSGRDANNRPGPVEQALIGTPLRGVASGGKEVPVEALIIVHSFDPCIACSIHVIDPKNNIVKHVWEEGGVRG